jgi:hypothetical protein
LARWRSDRRRRISSGGFGNSRVVAAMIDYQHPLTGHYAKADHKEQQSFDGPSGQPLNEPTGMASGNMITFEPQMVGSHSECDRAGFGGPDTSSEERSRERTFHVACAAPRASLGAVIAA